jgi:prepilin-type N-terminal cleavage/methylation domain-containing protein
MKVQAKGFTLLELIVVMLVVVIISLFIGIRLPSTSLFSQPSAAEQVRRDIRYTQILAMSLNASYSIAFTTNSYTITPNPPGGAYTITMPPGVTLSTSTITFDSMGAPSAASSVTITASGSTTTLNISAETGFVNG